MGRLIPAGTGLPAYKRLNVVIDEKSPTYAPWPEVNEQLMRSMLAAFDQKWWSEGVALRPAFDDAKSRDI